MAEDKLPVDPAHLETLYEITRYLNSSLDLDVVLNYVMDRVVQVTHAERGFMMIVEEESDLLRFQVARGIDQQDLDSPEFEVSTTIINEVAVSQKPLLTSNAQHDSNLPDAQSFIRKGLRSILCVPILARDRLIGLVYVDNRLKVGMFNDTHRDLLATFASQAGFAIENARLYKVAVEKGRLQQELEMAHKIQRGLLPTTFDPLSGYEIAFDWRSAREVAGDFYDYFMLNDHQMGVVIADVSDKGAAAAIFMAVASSKFKGNAFVATSPESVIQLTNQMLVQDATDGMFVTIYYAVFEQDGYVQCVNAGHNLPVLYRAKDRTIEFLPKGGHALGWFDHIPLQTHEYQLDQGDVIVFYTDGLTEAENLNGQPYGEDSLAEMIMACGDRPAEAIKTQIIESVQHFVGNAPTLDDITLIVVRYTG
jgi:sigma-B regulation protein RsbU (phosphoserine phosphatase)